MLGRGEFRNNQMPLRLLNKTNHRRRLIVSTTKNRITEVYVSLPLHLEMRWQVEECFRIMKTDFEARPVYVKRKDRILTHFITCFIALIVYRYLEQKFTTQTIPSFSLYILHIQQNFSLHNSRHFL